MYLWLSAPILPQPEGGMFSDVLGDWAVLVIYVPKDAGIHRTDFDTGGGDPPVYARGESEFGGSIDTLDAESAFLNHTARS
jgi:hypothetical protein